MKKKIYDAGFCANATEYYHACTKLRPAASISKAVLGKSMSGFNGIRSQHENAHTSEESRLEKESKLLHISFRLKYGQKLCNRMDLVKIHRSDQKKTQYIA
ncbi:MAG: hypothetical protein N838_10565 [Thiohalocapsa sp. PB-PSB1]|nr:MAG: hypothetical protein N838_10565 [Thiohalocapsa sp. PB-PSB1]HCS88490.1 hypothetical protein [Chromatiaceae bacterium]